MSLIQVALKCTVTDQMEKKVEIARSQFNNDWRLNNTRNRPHYPIALFPWWPSIDKAHESVHLPPNIHIVNTARDHYCPYAHKLNIYASPRMMIILIIIRNVVRQHTAAGDSLIGVSCARDHSH